MARRSKKPEYTKNKAIVDSELLTKVAEVYKEVCEKNKSAAAPLNPDSYRLIELAAK